MCGRSFSRFNPRTRTGCDLFFIQNYLIKGCFNPRTRTGCDCLIFYVIQLADGFNPRTRTGCDAALSFGVTMRPVSIHAPARGATCAVHESRQAPACFNPRTRTGCDSTWSASNCSTGRFNPRTRTGCDANGLIKLACRAVSIHAPARGATKYDGKHITSTEVSIHAPARGATVDADLALELMKFQSTHPHGVRPRLGYLGCVNDSFNPRTRTGCDCALDSLKHIFYSFNPRTRTGCDAGFFK